MLAANDGEIIIERRGVCSCSHLLCFFRQDFVVFVLLLVVLLLVVAAVCRRDCLCCCRVLFPFSWLSDTQWPARGALPPFVCAQPSESTLFVCVLLCVSHHSSAPRPLSSSFIITFITFIFYHACVCV